MRCADSEWEMGDLTPDFPVARVAAVHDWKFGVLQGKA